MTDLSNAISCNATGLKISQKIYQDIRLPWPIRVQSLAHMSKCSVLEGTKAANESEANDFPIKTSFEKLTKSEGLKWVLNILKAWHFLRCDLSASMVAEIYEILDLWERS